MKAILLLGAFALAGAWAATSAANGASYKRHPSTNAAVSGGCSGDTVDSHEALRRLAEYEETRASGTGLSLSNVSEAQTLGAPGDNGMCVRLDASFAEAIAETHSDGSPRYRVAHFRWRTYYLTTITIAQPPSGELIVMGRSFADISDANGAPIVGITF